MDITQRYNSVHIDGNYVKNEETIKKHYADVNVKVDTFTFERSIRFKEDDILLKWTAFRKHREKGKKYFSKRFDSSLLKVNTKTGNFLTVRAQGTSKHRKRSNIKTNSFDELHNFLLGTYFWQPSAYFKHSRGYRPQVNINEIFTNKGFHDRLPFFLHSMEGFYRFFIEKKNIKVPDEGYEKLLSEYYPTEKYFKTNDRKLVQSVMDVLGIKSKFSIKVFHRNPKLNIPHYTFLYKLLGGEPNISNVRESIYCDEEPFHGNFGHNKWSVIRFNRDIDFNLPDQVKSNIIKILNDPMRVLDGYELTGLIYDHLRMIKKIKPYYPDITISSTTYKTFMLDHSYVSKLHSEINKGYEVVFKYDDDMVRKIESLTFPGGIQPYILKSESDYREEGDRMKHCVYSYLDYENSLLISLRSPLDVRVTVEYDTKSGELKQHKTTSNHPSPMNFKKIIEDDLTPIVVSYAKKGKLKQMDREERPIIINGKMVPMREPIDLPF